MLITDLLIYFNSKFIIHPSNSVESNCLLSDNHRNDLKNIRPLKEHFDFMKKKGWDIIGLLIYTFLETTIQRTDRPFESSWFWTAVSCLWLKNCLYSVFLRRANRLFCSGFALSAWIGHALFDAVVVSSTDNQFLPAVREKNVSMKSSLTSVWVSVIVLILHSSTFN